MKSIKFVLCSDENNCIGKNGDLLYKIDIDMKRFVSLTTSKKEVKNGIIMGFNTWNSLGKRRPLKNRVNIVLTNKNYDKVHQEGGIPFKTIDDVMNFINKDEIKMNNIYVIGGGQIYDLFAKHPIYKYYIDCIYWSVVHKKEQYDDSKKNHYTYFSVYDNFENFKTIEDWKMKVDDTIDISFRTLIRDEPLLVSNNKESVTHYELQYLKIMKQLLLCPIRQTRNAFVHSSFGGKITIDLSDNYVPLLTTKRMAWKTVIKELLWFVNGDTDNKKLMEQNVHIWDANASRSFLDSRGLNNYEENDLGPVYGFQWRHFGDKYINCSTNYVKGVDQLEQIRHQLLNEPHSRRILLSAWNPADLDKMALPPCHVLTQWYVDSNNKIWMQLYQRSGDMFLGVPFNLFSYATLIHMMSHLTGLKPGGMIHILGDMHIYQEHQKAVSDQLKRCPKISPKLYINDLESKIQKWEDFQIEHFKLEGYMYHPSIKAPMIA